MDLSAVIITFNEERNIGRCLESLLGVADDIVVVDSFSTDKTREICLSYGVRFESHTFDGYIEQKNYALTRAKYQLVLSLDADEALSDELRQSILRVKSNKLYDGYTMNRFTNYCGQWIRHSGWYPDRKLRLWTISKGRWGGINPHDKVIMDKGTSVSHLKGDILHYSYYTREEHDRQMERFSDIAAKALFDKGIKSSCLKLSINPFWRFIKAYFIKTGFLDGKNGFIISRSSARVTYLKYKKLRRLYAEKVSANQ